MSGQPDHGEVTEIVSAAAGAAIHYAMLPENEAAFTAYLNECRDPGDQVPAAKIRKMMSLVHDMVAPDCDEPIEAI